MINDRFNISSKAEYDNQTGDEIKFMTTTDIMRTIEKSTKANLVLKKIGKALKVLGHVRESGKKATSQNSCKGYYVKPVFVKDAFLSDSTDSKGNYWYKVLIINRKLESDN